MTDHRVAVAGPVRQDEINWMPFPGGELEGAQPRALCPACRAELSRASVDGQGTSGARKRALCFQCYRTGLARDRALKAAGELDTATDARFQSLLPFEPVNKARLEMLKVERLAARAARPPMTARLEDARHRAQQAARRAVAQLLDGIRARNGVRVETNRAFLSAAHAAELQLPDSWLPYVMSR